MIMTQSLVKNFNLDLELRYAHIDGHTELDFVPGKNQVITVGVDCEARIWSLENDPDNGGVQASFGVEDVPYSLAITDQRVFVALASNCVKSFELNEFGEDETLVTRFTSNATCLSLSVDHELLAIGAADFNIKLVELSDQTTKTLEGHEGPILSVAVDPLRKYLVSSACDGTVCLWSIHTKMLQHKWSKMLAKSNDFENSSSLCRMSWQPKFGECLAIPTENAVEIYKRGQWENVYKKVKHPESPREPFSIVCFSTDGLSLAAATKSSLAIWRMDQINLGNFQPIAMLLNVENSITCLKFNPNNAQQLCCADGGGSLRILKINASSKADAAPAKSSNSMEKVPEPEMSQKTMDAILADFEMDDEDLEIDLDNAKSSAKIEKNEEKKTAIFETKKINEQKNAMQFSELIDEVDVDIPVENDEDFDISAIKSKYEPLIFGSDGIDDRENPKTADGLMPTITNKLKSSSELVIDGFRITGKDLLDLCRGARYQPPLRQPAFQSGSTPTHYKNRFMVWNSVGIVYSYNSDEERSIDVEFHDIAFHHSIHLTNMYNYTMADLSTACLLLASNGDDESEDYLDHNKARLFCLQFNSWDPIKEWQVELPSEELFECITASQTFVAGLTNKQFLRVWTVGGIQTMIRSIDGPAINLSSYEKFIMVLFHQASQHVEFGQSVSCFSLKIDHQGKTRAHLIPQPVPVALTPKSMVYWAGFTDEGTPCVMDSDGIVRVYKSHFGKGWFPLCATKQHANGKSDNFFIIGLSEIQAQVRCIFCKASRYPDTVPKPTLTVLPLQIPLCELDGQMVNNNAKAKNEEECLRYRWLVSLLKRLSLDGYDVDESLEEAEKRVISSLIKLFAIALGAEREFLALEIAKLLPNSQALEGAVQYAERQRHRSLAMKLIEMIQTEPDGFNPDDEQDDVNSDVEIQELMTKKNVDRLRQILKDDPKQQEHSMISLTRHQNADDLNDKRFTTLKPKSMKKSTNEQSGSTEPNLIDLDDEDDIEEVVENGQDDSDIDHLHPKKIASKNHVKNPFKVINKDKHGKRKQIDSDDESAKNGDSDEDDFVPINRHVQESDNDDDDEDEVDDHKTEPEPTLETDKGFMFYFEENRVKLFEEHGESETIESEQDLLNFALKTYAKLSEKQQAKWLQKALKNDQAKTKKSLSKNNKENKGTSKRLKPSSSVNDHSQDGDENVKINKITNFFTKKN